MLWSMQATNMADDAPADVPADVPAAEAPAETTSAETPTPVDAKAEKKRLAAEAKAAKAAAKEEAAVLKRQATVAKKAAVAEAKEMKRQATIAKKKATLAKKDPVLAAKLAAEKKMAEEKAAAAELYADAGDEEELAATKLQATFRGHSVRRATRDKEAAAAEEAAAALANYKTPDKPEELSPEELKGRKLPRVSSNTIIAPTQTEQDSALLNAAKDKGVKDGLVAAQQRHQEIENEKKAAEQNRRASLKKSTSAGKKALDRAAAIAEANVSAAIADKITEAIIGNAEIKVPTIRADRPVPADAEQMMNIVDEQERIAEEAAEEAAAKAEWERSRKHISSPQKMETKSGGKKKLSKKEAKNAQIDAVALAKEQAKREALEAQAEAAFQAKFAAAKAKRDKDETEEAERKHAEARRDAVAKDAARVKAEQEADAAEAVRLAAIAAAEKEKRDAHDERMRIAKKHQDMHSGDFGSTPHLRGAQQ